MKREGLFFIISAPSGAGKTSLCEEATILFPDLYYSVSYTTRPPRPSEKDGKDYHFVTEDKFQEMIDERKFVEWAEVHGSRYGTAYDPIKECQQRGIDVILDIDAQGAKQITNGFPNGVSIFVLPPSWQELENRLRLRGSDSNEDIERRLQNAKGELREIERYHYLVVNDDFKEAVSTLKSIVIAERCKRDRILPLIKDLYRLR